MFPDPLDIACRQCAEARAVASHYVAPYGVDALTLARMARVDVTARGRDARAALYAEAIAILGLKSA